METYKDSGIEWIGEIPEEWNLDIAKNIFREHKLRNDKNLENNLLSLSYGKIVQKDIESLAGLIPESFSTYNIIQKDDIVLRLTDLQNDKRSLRTAICKKNRGIITSAYLTLRLNTNNNASYLHYLLHSYDVCKVFYNLGGGVRLGGSWSDVGKLHLLLPPLQEQAAIADFLDKKNAEIDAITAKITQQIQTLKDYRQSLITETVTKGLDNTVSYKDSGIKWIGEIPEGWEISPFKHLFDTNKGLTITKENLVEVGIPVINYGQIHSMFKTEVVSTDNDLPKVSEKFLIYQKSLVKQGNFIFADTSEDLEGAGNFSTRLDSDSLLFAGYHTIISRAKFLDKFNYNYFKNLFDSDFFRNQIRIRVSGVKVFSITQSILNNCIVLIPPLQEQATIADFLDDKTAKIDRIIAKKEQQLDIIKEHRKSLIYEYVTGKKRVKEYQQDGN